MDKHETRKKGLRPSIPSVTSYCHVVAVGVDENLWAVMVKGADQEHEVHRFTDKTEAEHACFIIQNAMLLYGRQLWQVKNLAL